LSESPRLGFERGLEAGELRFQRCEGCERAIFYPRVLCPFCGSAELAWAASAGEGTVYATTAMPRRQNPSRHVCLVDLDEGFRVMSRVDGVAAEEVVIGDRVRLSIVPGDEDDALPVAAFRPTTTAGADGPISPEGSAGSAHRPPEPW
jgi:uncharacterized OB-fold protein